MTFDYLDLAHDLAAAAAAAGRGGAAPPPGVVGRVGVLGRRARLREHFGFDCECVVCLREIATSHGTMQGT